MTARERMLELMELPLDELRSRPAVHGPVPFPQRGRNWSEVVYHDVMPGGGHRIVVVHRDSFVGWHEASGFAIDATGMKHELALDEIREFL